MLVACEYSGIVRDAFRKRGHTALSCDLLSSDAPGPHWRGDVVEVLEEPWDLVIAHPPCTYLANSGVRFLHEPDQEEPFKRGKPRWAAMKEAAAFFNLFLDCQAPMVCVENPIMHGYGQALLRRKYSQIVQPWMFGHKQTKATCLWLRGLPVLQQTTSLKEETMKLPPAERMLLANLGPSVDRGKLRSKTFQGVADAMADQWGGL